MERITTDRLIAFIDGELNLDERNATAAALKRDASACEIVDRLRDVTGAMRGAIEVPPSPDFAESIRMQIIEETSDTLPVVPAAARRRSHPGRNRIELRRPRRFAMFAATMSVGFSVALAAVGLFLVPFNAPSTREDVFFARGVEVPDGSRRVGFEIFAHEGGAPKASRKLDNGSDVRREDGLSFVIYNREHEADWLFLFAADAAGEIHWFYPSDASSAESSAYTPLSAFSSRDVFPLPEGVLLTDFPPGPARVVAVFSKIVLPVEDIEEAIRKQAPGKQALENLGSPNHPEVTIRTMTLNVVGKEG